MFYQAFTLYFEDIAYNVRRWSHESIFSLLIITIIISYLLLAENSKIGYTFSLHLLVVATALSI